LVAWIEWNVKAIVEDAYDNSNPAEFLVRDATEGSGSANLQTRFYSREYTEDTSLQPKLTIEYTEAVTTLPFRSIYPHILIR